MRCSVNRLLQLATKPRLQSMRSDTSSQVWPSASSKISRARRASSARSVRLLARRVSSISSEFDNVIASLMDAIIVYKWLLQSTSLPFRLRALPAGRTRTLPPNKLLSPLDGKPAHTSYSANQEDKGYEYRTNGPRCNPGQPRTMGRFLDPRSLDRPSSRLMRRIKA